MTDARQGRTFALTLSGGFLFLGLVAQLRHRDAAALVTFTLSAISVLAALIIPARLGPVRRQWMKLGDAISHVTTPIVMAIVYYLVVTPIGVAKRLRGGRRAATDSFWHERPPLPDAARMERQF